MDRPQPPHGQNGRDGEQNDAQDEGADGVPAARSREERGRTARDAAGRGRTARDDAELGRAEVDVPSPSLSGRARRPRARATMRDVACHADVSIKTVSRVVNREPGVAEETVARVRRAAEELGYTRDVGAGSLRSAQGRSWSLGLLLGSVGNAFDASINRGVGDVAQENGMSVIVASTGENPHRERALVGALIGRRVDALIIMPARTDQSYLMPEVAHGTPVVAVDRPATGIDVDEVLVDNRLGARKGVEHLISHGHRRIAALGHVSRLRTVADRFAGTRDALVDAGIRPDPELLIDGIDDEAQSRAAVRALLALPEPPTAIFTSRNEITVGAVRALQELDMQHRIAVLGFDDFEQADLLDPPVSVVAQDPIASGRLAARRALARLADPELPVETVVVPTRLILRRSCGCGRDTVGAAPGIHGVAAGPGTLHP